MIPNEIIEFLKSPHTAVAGIERDLVPVASPVWGWHVDPKASTVACFLAPGFEGAFGEAPEGIFALTACEPGTARTYQLKGRLVGLSAMDESDLAAFDDFKTRWVALLGTLGYPAEVLIPFMGPPRVKVSFEVSEIFDQTPGPGAGAPVFAETGS